MLAGDLSAFTQALEDEDRRRRLEAASRSVSTVRELLGRAREYLERKGVPSPKLDAEYLLAHVLGVPRLELYLDHDRPLEAAEVDRLRELVRRRGKREPLAYVLGSWSFYGLELHCDARALVPRPETEVLVERCLALLEGTPSAEHRRRRHRHRRDRPGARGATPGASVTAIDISPGALALAAENAALNGLAGRVELLEGDLLAPVAGRRFDLVASNPPYVAAGEASTRRSPTTSPRWRCTPTTAAGRSSSASHGRPGALRPGAPRGRGRPRARRRGSPSTSPALGYAASR